MEDQFPRLKEMGTAEDVMKNIFLRMLEEAKKQKRKGMRILIPAVIGGCVLLIGLGIIIGKYIL